MNVVVRRAGSADVDELVAMRRVFTFEGEAIQISHPPPSIASVKNARHSASYSGRAALPSGSEADGQIVSHVCIALIAKVPRPTRENSRIAYLTNVYTRRSYRGRAIGGKLLKQAQEAALRAGVELMIVWPSDESIDFYKRHGFEAPGEPLIWKASPRGPDTAGSSHSGR